MGNSNIKTLIEQRASELADAYTSENIDNLMSFFSQEVDFSDIAMSTYNLDHTSLRGFYDMMYGALHSMTITNVTASGTSPDFVTWEMDLGFVMKADNEHLGLKTGAKVIMRGAALQWWREEDGKWKIWKERDYFIVKKE